MAKMTIGMKQTATAFLAGAVDIGAEYLDKNQGWTQPFQNSVDIFRALGTVGGFLANYTKIETEYSETLFYSTLPLFMKSAKRAIETWMAPAPYTRPGGSRAAPSESRKSEYLPVEV